MRVALIVEPDERKRSRLMAAADACGLHTLLTNSVFDAMSLLGQAELGALAFPVGSRVLAVRGLCQLALRHHPDVVLYAMREPGVDPLDVLEKLDYPLLEVIEPTRLVDMLPDVAARLRAHTFGIASTNADDEDTQANPVWPTSNLEIVEDEDEDEAYDDDPTLINRTVDLVIAPDTESGANLRSPLVSDEPTMPFRSRAPSISTPAPVELEDAPTSPYLGVVLSNEATQSGTGPQIPISATLPAIPDDASTTSESTALLVGDLHETAGVEVLMTLSAQGLTGRLAIDDAGATVASVFFYAGDPVWAEHPGGPSGWLEEITKGGHVPEGTEAEAESESALIASLLERDLLKGQVSHNLCRGLVSARVNTIVDQATGNFSFHERGDFLQTAPLVRVSLFGLLLSRLRVRSNPSELLRRSNELGEMRVFPMPSLVMVAPRLNSFAAGHNLAHVIDGKRLAREIWAELRLDPVTGVLLLTTLLDSKLCTLDDDPVEQTGRVELSVPESKPMTVVPYADLEAGSSEEEESARDEIFALYMRLKPLTIPREVLGVALDAGLEQIEAAYKKRMEALRPERIPAGSARQLMVARVLELREKVTRAYDAMRLMEATGSHNRSPW